jgi:hypothetical protein
VDPSCTAGNWLVLLYLTNETENEPDRQPLILPDDFDPIDEATDIRSDLNLRDMPVAVQFPDWRLWQPRTIRWIYGVWSSGRTAKAQPFDSTS